jgi:hypothetical protein
MEDLIVSLLPQMPVVVVILAIGMVIRQDVNRHFEYLETLVDTLIGLLVRDKE